MTDPDLLQEATDIVDRVTDWMKQAKHKLNGLYDELEGYMTEEITPSDIATMQNRIGECRLLVKCCIKELET